MTDQPTQPPEGRLIAAALKRSGLSARAAAQRAGISDARWRQIVSGYQTVSGTRVPVRAPADTLARMAQVVGVTAEQLADDGREDAADELRDLGPIEEPEPEPSIADLAAQLAEERRARLNLERQFNEFLAEQKADRKRRGETG